MHNIPTILKLPNIIYINSFNTKSPPQKPQARQQRQNTYHKHKLLNLRTSTVACHMAIMDHTKVFELRDVRRLSSVLW